MKTLLMLAAAAAATPAPKPALAPSEIVAASPASDWVAIAPSDLLVMDLSTGKRVVIQLMPPPFSQGWVGNIRKLAAARFWDGTSVNRVQDNYVVQWGDANAEDKAKAKALPPGLAKVGESEYSVPLARLSSPFRCNLDWNSVFPGKANSPKVNPMVPFYSQSCTGRYKLVLSGTSGDPPDALYDRIDSYSDYAGFNSGWAVAASTKPEAAWPIHCYGMVGVGRDMPPDTGTGAELYTVIGHAPRHLDRNIALVGRVISGIENLSSLPRGTGPLGFFEKPEERTRITSIRIGTEVKDVPRFEYLSTESASFAKYADARANRRDPFFIVPAGGADICNIPVPVRVLK
jgi:cyclophilin family peptidyl-prolyl cis-trans isomerase